MNELINDAAVERHEKAYAGGENHEYPNENMVRLIKWYFTEPRKGRVLDYGFGSGENLLHLLRKGFSVCGVEVSNEAKKITETKLAKHLWLKADLYVLKAEDKKLPFGDNHFDYILSNQTIYYLPEEKILHLLEEFKRVLKPNGKMIVSMASRFNSLCTEGKPLGNNFYEYNGKGMGLQQVYIAKNETHLRKLFSMFEIDEIGHFDNYYCGIAGHHYVVLARNKKEARK